MAVEVDLRNPVEAAFPEQGIGAVDRLLLDIEREHPAGFTGQPGEIGGVIAASGGCVDAEVAGTDMLGKESVGERKGVRRSKLSSITASVTKSTPRTPGISTM